MGAMSLARWLAAPKPAAGHDQVLYGLLALLHCVTVSAAEWSRFDVGLVGPPGAWKTGGKGVTARLVAADEGRHLRVTDPGGYLTCRHN